MRIPGAVLVGVLLVLAGGLCAQSTPVAAPPGGSSFAASGTGGIDFELTIGTGQTLASADIQITDADNPTGVQTITLTSVTGANPTGVTSPSAPVSGTAGAALNISWMGTVNVSATPGNYDYTINFQDDEGTPNTDSAVIRIIVVDSNPFATQGADAVAGDGTVGNPFRPSNQVVGTTPVLDLVEVNDLNSSLTLVIVAVVDGGGNPTTGSGFTIDDNNPGVGATMFIDATANAALNANDIGVYTFEVEVTDSINTIFINISITVVAANVNPVLGAPSGTVDIVVGGADPNFTGTATVGDNLAITFQATDANGGDTLTVTATRTGGSHATPAAAGFTGTFPASSAGTSPEAVTLAGTAAAAGTITFTIDVDDGNSGTDTYTISLTISAAANPSPTIGVNAGGGPVTSGGTVNVLTGSTVAALNVQITVNDASTGDSVTLTAGITNQGTTGIVIAQWQGAATSPTPINANPTTGTFNAATTLVVTLTANDGVNPNVVFTFNITVSNSPTITVTAPNGGENFSVGGNMNVTWSSAGVTGNVDILLSTDGGGSFPITLIAGTANDNAQTIVVPNNPSTQCRVRVEDSNTGTTFDTSNANFTISVPAPSAATMSSAGNPGSGNANAGATATALGFRLTETGGSSNFIVTSVTVRVTTFNNTGGVAVAAVSSISLRRGGILQSITNGGAGWSVVGDVITVNFTGLSSSVSAGGSADFTVAISFSGSSVPSPNPRYQAAITTTDVNGGASVTGANVTGGTITLIEELPDDPLDEDTTEDSCQLAAHGGPAWPLLAAGLLFAIVAMRRRKASGREV
jgi:hypothetical protein